MPLSVSLMHISYWVFLFLFPFCPTFPFHFVFSGLLFSQIAIFRWEIKVFFFFIWVCCCLKLLLFFSLYLWKTYLWWFVKLLTFSPHTYQLDYRICFSPHTCHFVCLFGNFLGNFQMIIQRFLLVNCTLEYLCFLSPFQCWDKLKRKGKSRPKWKKRPSILYTYTHN